MTVTTTEGKITYDGDDATITFPTTFKFQENGHVKVTLRDASDVETEWVEGTQFTLTGAGDAAGGNVVVATTPTDYTPATGESLVIELDVPFTQGRALPLAGALPSTEVEKGLDLLTLLCTQLNELFERTMRVPTSDTQLGDNLLLPIDADRASMFLAFDADGMPIAAEGTSASLGPVTPFIDTLLDDVDAATARATLGALSASDDLTFTGTIIFQNNSVQAISTDAGSSEGPGIDAYRSSASPAAADIIGAFRSKGKSSTGVERTYAKWVGTIDDPANGVEYGHGSAAAIQNGTLTNVYHWGAGLYTQGQSDPGAGKIAATGLPIQSVTASSVTAGSTTAIIPFDDTIPQSSEGAEVITASITPHNASSTLKIEVVAPFTGTATIAFVLALFQDSGADAIFATFSTISPAGGQGALVSFHTFVAAGSITARTYKLRAGPESAATLHWNSDLGSARFSTIGPEVRMTITEILP